MFAIIVAFVCVVMQGFAVGKTSNDLEFSHSHSREGKFFPFYTIGRFANSVCVGSNGLLGTCVIRGECADNGGVVTGSCVASVTNQAVCCVYERTCGSTTNLNSTYFFNEGYPNAFDGGNRCGITVQKISPDICQLRIDFLDFNLAQPNGDGVCLNDYMVISGGSTRVPRICGENTKSHIYVNFNERGSIAIAFDTTETYAFHRRWHLQLSQIECASETLAPSGCLQYYFEEESSVRSFNYGSSPNSNFNGLGIPGTRQLANNRYGICIKVGPNKCSIVWSQPTTDRYSFTVDGDVGGVDPAVLGTDIVANNVCLTDYVLIPNAMQNELPLPSDRLCGMGFIETTSIAKPFVLYVVNDANEINDMANRGFYLDYKQEPCPVA